jgi:hypothetical protein
MAEPEIDGLLVGGASLDPVRFAAIVNLRSLNQRIFRSGETALTARRQTRQSVGGHRQRKIERFPYPRLLSHTYVPAAMDLLMLV